jgi:hypothetical protein
MTFIVRGLIYNIIIMSNKFINYFSISPGNNSTAIQTALLKRGCWAPIPP